MLPDGRRLGAHLPLPAGLVRAADRAREIGADALQIFSDNPTAWRRRPELPDELAAFRASLAAKDIGPLAIHASYLINLPGPEPDLAARSISLLAAEMASAPAFGARFVNVHIGSHRDTSVSAGIARLADAVVAVLAAGDGGADGPVLVLENSAGGGFGLGTDAVELGAIAESLAVRGVPDDRVGFCLDTAHAWGAGADLATVESVDAFLDELDSRVGLERVAMVHLNDSRAERGSLLDRHEHLGAGRIGRIGLGRILTHPSLANAIYYLETPGMSEGYDAVNLQRARDIVAGRDLATLPDEAFAIRSSRSRIGPGPVDDRDGDTAVVATDEAAS